ncbi:hypothetical protein A3K63_01330 [Candidatus Micrarchaeota archaeon RBG_16_49_10]|nr:MAG: hypothetical protein A3K63_01330 [Candidatus Micrarchaeota archaeon RBG_16_49_10]
MVFEKRPQSQAVNPEVLRTAQESKGRIRLLEHNVETVRSRVNAVEEKMIEEMGNVKKWLDQLSEDVNQVSKSLKEIHAEILRMNKELEKKARKSEVKELESLLDIYNPIKSHFVTRDEAARLFDDMRKKP